MSDSPIYAAILVAGVGVFFWGISKIMQAFYRGEEAIATTAMAPTVFDYPLPTYVTTMTTTTVHRRLPNRYPSSRGYGRGDA